MKVSVKFHILMMVLQVVTEQKPENEFSVSSKK